MKAVASNSEISQKRRPLRQCNAAKKVNETEMLKNKEKIITTSKKVDNADKKACSKKLARSSKVNKENIFITKKQSVKEILTERPVEEKKVACYKSLSATSKDEKNCNDDVYDIFLDKDMQDVNLTKKVKKRPIKNKESQASSRAKKYKKIQVFSLGKLEDIHSLKASASKPIKDQLKITQIQSTSSRQAQSSTLKKDAQSAMLLDRHTERLSNNQLNSPSMNPSKESCMENNLQNISSRSLTCDLSDNFNVITDSLITNKENPKCSSKDLEMCQAPSVAHILTSANSCHGITDSQGNAEGSSESMDFYSEFELSFSAMEMMHSTPEKTRSIPNSALSLRIKNSPIPKIFSNGLKEREIIANSLRANSRIKNNVVNKENQSKNTNSLSNTSQTKIVSYVQGNLQINKELGLDHFEISDKEGQEITLYESPVKAPPVEKAPQIELVNCSETDMLKAKEKISFESAEENLNYPSINLFEEFDSPMPIQKGFSPPEIKEQVLKPNKGYHTPKLFRKHLSKNKKCDAAAVQKKKAETKLDKWAIMLNNHFDEIEEVDLCVE